MQSSALLSYTARLSYRLQPRCVIYRRNHGFLTHYTSLQDRGGHFSPGTSWFFPSTERGGILLSMDHTLIRYVMSTLMIGCVSAYRARLQQTPCILPPSFELLAQQIAKYSGCFPKNPFSVKVSSISVTETHQDNTPEARHMAKTCHNLVHRQNLDHQ